MATTVTAGVSIKFEHTVASILDAVETATGNIASKLKEQNAETLDEFTLSADELYHFHQYLKEVHLHVSRIMRKMALGIANAMVIDDTKVSYTIKDKEGYDATILPVFDRIIFETIKNFIIKEWFIQCGLKDWAEYYSVKYQDSLRMIPKYSMSLRSSSLT